MDTMPPSGRTRSFPPANLRRRPSTGPGIRPEGHPGPSGLGLRAPMRPARPPASDVARRRRVAYRSKRPPVAPVPELSETVPAPPVVRLGLPSGVEGAQLPACGVVARGPFGHDVRFPRRRPVRLRERRHARAKCRRPAGISTINQYPYALRTQTSYVAGSARSRGTPRIRPCSWHIARRAVTGHTARP